MNTKQIQTLQEHVGTKPDGFWGRLSIASCQRHLRAFMPRPNPWPQPTHAALVKFYGEPGNESNLVHLPVSGLGVRYQGAPVRHIRCHRLVAESLLAALADISAGHDADVLRYYAGCFNARKMRGGTSWSLHAWGAAIDLWPESNANNAHWPTKAHMPISVMEAFACQGWLPAGAFWSRDAMHFQATS